MGVINRRTREKMAVPVSQWQQLQWMLWKNLRLKIRNAKSTAKELCFPVYTFLLVSLLRGVVDLGGNSEPIQWPAVRVPSLINTHAGWLCSNADERAGKGWKGNVESAKHERWRGGYWEDGVEWRGLSKPEGAVGGAVGGSTGGGSNVTGCVVVMSPGTSAWVQSMSGTLQRMFGSKSSSIRVHLADNATEAKRFHLDNPGHVLAAIDLHVTPSERYPGDTACSSSTQRPATGDPTFEQPVCNVKVDVRLNATTLLEIKSGMSPLADVNTALLSVQDTLHEALRRNVWAKTPADIAGTVDVTTMPFPVAPLGKLEAAETKMSLITSLYFVAAWIPSMQVRQYLYFSTSVQKYTY